MSTTNNFNVRKGIPALVKARVWGKYDYSQNHTFTQENENLDITMDKYNGVSFQRIQNYNNIDTLDFSNTILPWKWEYGKYLKQKRYAFAPIGQDYNIYPISYMYNFDIVGNPTINNENKTVNNFSTSNYLEIPKKLNFGTSDYEIIVPFMITQLNSAWSVILQSATGSYFSLSISPETNGESFISTNSGNGSSWSTSMKGTTPLQLNTNYLVKVTRVSGTRTMYLSSDDGAIWSNEGSIADTYSYSTLYNIGIGGTTLPFTYGTIFLDDVSIKINNTVVFEPEITQQAKQELNTTVVGSPTINSQFIASNFSTSNYLEINKIPENISNCVIRFKIKTPSIVTTSGHKVILGQKTNNFMTPQIELNSSTGYLSVLFTGNGASPWKSITTNSALLTDTVYWIEVTWSGTTVELKLSTDGTNFTSVGTLASNSFYWNDYCFIGRDNDTSSVFTGSIYLEDSYIAINALEWWKGTKDVVETLPGCLYNYNNEQTVQSFAINGDESIVLSPDDYYDPGYWLQTLNLGE